MLNKIVRLLFIYLFIKLFFIVFIHIITILDRYFYLCNNNNKYDIMKDNNVLPMYCYKFITSNNLATNLLTHIIQL